MYFVVFWAQFSQRWRSPDLCSLPHQLVVRTVGVFWTGRRELQSQLDSAVEDLRQKLNAVQEVERNAVRAAMLEERARYCLFIGAIKPLIVRVYLSAFWHYFIV